MKVKTVWQRFAPRPAVRPIATDWTNGWSLRDLADLPHHHPRRDDR